MVTYADMTLLNQLPGVGVSLYTRKDTDTAGLDKGTRVVRKKRRQALQS